MFVGNVQTIRKRVKNKQSKKKYKKNERKKIEWKSENSKKKNEKRKSSEKERGGVARILFFNWVIYDPSDDLRSYSDDDCFVFTVRKKTTRSSSFFFFLLATLLSFLRFLFLLLSICLLFLYHFFCCVLLVVRQATCYFATSRLLFPRIHLHTLLPRKVFHFFPFSLFFARCGLGKKDSARKKKILEAAKGNERSRRTMGLGVPTMPLIFMGFFGLKRCVHVGDFPSSPSSHRCGCFIRIVKSLRLERIFFSSRKAPDETLGSPTRAMVTKSSRKNSWKKSWKNSRLNEIYAKTVIMNCDVVISCWASCKSNNYRCFVTTDRPNYR